MIIVEGNVNCNALFKQVLLFHKKYELVNKLKLDKKVGRSKLNSTDLLTKSTRMHHEWGRRCSVSTLNNKIIKHYTV